MATLSLSAETSTETLSVHLEDQDATETLGRILGLHAETGDVIFLVGDLGAGKTSLCRGFIQQFFNQPGLDVPSPSFLLCLTYADDSATSAAPTIKGADADVRHTVAAPSSRIPGVVIHHIDPYRLRVGQVAGVIDFEQVFKHHIALIEWPDRLGSTLVDPNPDGPPHPARLVVELSGTGSQGASRTATLTAVGPVWAARLAQWKAAHAVTAVAPPPPTTTAEPLPSWPTVGSAVKPSTPTSEWIVLGVESSCDDTAAAVVRGDGTVISHVVASQRGLHERFGGVKPDVAQRAHARVIWRVIETALAEAAASMGGGGGGGGENSTLPWTSFGSGEEEEGVADAADGDGERKEGGGDSRERALPMCGAMPPRCAEVCKKVGLTAVAATVGPGLALCLEVGVAAALSVAATCAVPFVPVHHMEAHALVASLSVSQGVGEKGGVTTAAARAAPLDGTSAPPCGGGVAGEAGDDACAADGTSLDPRLVPFLRSSSVAFPAAFVLCSGGHNMVVSAEAVGKYRIIGSTLDDSLGEYFDKTARVLGISAVPGGPHLEALAAKGNAAALSKTLPKPLAKTNDKVLRNGAAFSFAGLKAAVRGVVTTLLPALAPPPKATPHRKRKGPGGRGGRGEGAGEGGVQQHSDAPAAKRVCESGDGVATKGAGEAAVAVVEAEGGSGGDAPSEAANAQPPLVIEYNADGGKSLSYTPPPPPDGAVGSGGEGPGGVEVSFSALVDCVRADVAAAAQAKGVEHLEERVTRALRMIEDGDPSANPPVPSLKLKCVVVAGGVAANKLVRQAMVRAAAAVSAPLVCPPLKLCTDNGVMVAWTGMLRLALGLAQRPPAVDSVRRCVELRPRWPLGPRDPRCIRSGCGKGSAPLPGREKI